MAAAETPLRQIVPFSSSPAFATPLPRVLPRPQQPIRPDVLPIALPHAILRPVAFRTFTKKHNLTLTSDALIVLSDFIGRNCGASWREDGLAELLLEEVARAWKKTESKVIVSKSRELDTILSEVKSCMSGGHVVPVNVQHKEHVSYDLRDYFKVVSAFEQPRLRYDSSRKTFETLVSKPSFFPRANETLNNPKQRLQIIQQRVMQDEASTKDWKLTPIANLLGRSGSAHLLLGLVTVTAAGTLAISDLTGSIHLDLSQATSIDQVRTWLCPGMVVLVDGVYEEAHTPAGSSLGNAKGVGGMITGHFIGFSIGAPRCESRADTVNAQGSSGFAWTDFLGLGSERSVGARMRDIESKSTDGTIVSIGCMALDTKNLNSLKRVLATYSTAPTAFVLFGSFATEAAIATFSSVSAGRADSVAYKEGFDRLAQLLAEFPHLLEAKWIFVPGDGDAWPSAFSAGSAVPIPRGPVPEAFTGRVRKIFNGTPNGATWTTNPSRISVFGPLCEIVLFRDNISSRLRRTNIRVKPQTRADVGVSGADTISPAHTLVKTLLDQCHLSPFPSSIRPVHGDYGSALSLYPLPTLLMLCDPEIEPFVLGYQGCAVVNCGSLVDSTSDNIDANRGTAVSWIEYSIKSKQGRIVRLDA